MRRHGEPIPIQQSTFLILDENGNPFRTGVVISDITERKQAEQRTLQALELLKESETRYRELIDNQGEGLGVVDLEECFSFVNPAAEHIFGVPGGTLAGRSLREFMTEDQYLQMREQTKKRQAGATSTYELDIVRPSGETRRLLLTAVPRLDRAGVFVGTFGLFFDITERKQAEEALRQSEERYKLAVRGAGVGIWDWDIRTGKLYFSPRWKMLFGYGENDIGDSIDDWAKLLHPDERDWMLKFLEDFLAGTSPTTTVEYRLRHKDGSYRWIVAHGLVVRDEQGKACRFVGSHGDLTDRKRAEEALRRSEDELRAIYAGMFDGLLMADIETKHFVGANAAMSRMLGYSETELLSLSVKDIHPQADLPFVVEQFEKLSEGKIQVSEDVPVLRKDGSVFFAVVTSSPVIRNDRRCIVGFFHDITERKRAEEALRKEHRNLSHLLHASDHERQLIAYEIHDDLAQQLAGAIMQFDAFDHLKETKPKQAADAFHAGITMLRQGHFETRRLIAGVRPPILDESGIVEAVAHLVHELGRDKGQKIENRSKVDFDRLDPTLENAIYRIAQEALTNACKHSQSERISVSLLQRGDRLSIKIRDWGVGFDPKTIPKNHFGLEGIRQRARLLGGKCSIRSNVGKGTSITVSCPSC